MRPFLLGCLVGLLLLPAIAVPPDSSAAWIGCPLRSQQSGSGSGEGRPGPSRFGGVARDARRAVHGQGPLRTSTHWRITRDFRQRMQAAGI